MKKRTFLNLVSSGILGRAVTPFSMALAGDKFSNWSGNLIYGTDRVTEATSIEQIRSFVKAHAKFKVLGTRHCFNSIADSRDAFLSLKPMHEKIDVDAHARTVTVQTGITYGQLCPHLDAHGFALHNLTSLPHISVAGACSSGTR